MLSAALLRKKMLSVLQEKIVPDLTANSIRRLMLAGVPLQTPPGVTCRDLACPPLREEDARQAYPNGRIWESADVHAMRTPAIVCITAGEMDIKFGVTTSMLAHAGRQVEAGARCGGHIASFSAPAYLVVPPGVPLACGYVVPWYRPEPHTGLTNFVYIQVLPIGALCHLLTLKNGVPSTQYALFVEDAQLDPITGALIDELKVSSADQRAAQALLLGIMMRLHRAIDTHKPPLVDGLYSRFPEGAPSDLTSGVVHDPIIEKAHQFIQLHLHEPLSPELIAKHVRLGATQLNHVMRTHAGVSVMGYVKRLRMETAKLFLRSSTLSVEEISRLVGYRQQPHFSRTFRAYTGIPPLKFRQGTEPGRIDLHGTLRRQ